MANIIITSTATEINIVSGTYAETLDIKEVNYLKSDIEMIWEHEKDKGVEISMDAKILSQWKFVAPSEAPIKGCMIVDTINGVAPSNQADLFTKLKALR